MDPWSEGATKEGKSMDDGSILISMMDLEQWVDGRRI